jgi:hypothetical protein
MYNKEMRAPRNMTKRQMEEGMKPWDDYFSSLSKRGALESRAQVRRDGRAVRGPAARGYKAKTVDIEGYMVVKARNMAEAVKIAKGSPHARMRMGPTTIRECIEMDR